MARVSRTESADNPNAATAPSMIHGSAAIDTTDTRLIPTATAASSAAVTPVSHAVLARAASAPLLARPRPRAASAGLSKENLDKK